MQDPNEDTEWNDVLRAKGIIPDKPKEKEVSEEQIVEMLEKTIKERSGGESSFLSGEHCPDMIVPFFVVAVKDKEEMTLDELDELEDEEEERVLEMYRRQRMAEIKATQERSKYGEVREITGEDYVKEVNQAGDGVHVVLHLYRQGLPLCALINQHLSQLAVKFPTVKFLKAISTTCIPNYPDHNLPTIFVYFEGNLKSQLVGPMAFRGTSMKLEEMEYILGNTGAIDTPIKKDPKPAVKDVMMSSLRNGANANDDDDSSDNDW